MLRLPASLRTPVVDFLRDFCENVTRDVMHISLRRAADLVLPCGVFYFVAAASAFSAASFRATWLICQSDHEQ